MDFIGEAAAIGAALCFSLTSTMFTLAGRRYKPAVVMRVSVPVGMVVMMGVHWLTVGSPWPQVDLWRVPFLSVSGFIGFFLASIAIVNAFALIGPRLSLLIAAVNPILASILGWLLLDQALADWAIAGIVLTLGGIAIVITGRQQNRKSKEKLDPAILRKGIGFAILGATMQAFSFIFSSVGVSSDVAAMGFIGDSVLASFGTVDTLGAIDPISASLTRLMAGSLLLWVFALLQGQASETVGILGRWPIAFRHLMVGSIAGPVFGATLIMLSLQHAPAGIASTLANTSPIFLIPIGYFVFNEQITSRAIVGTVVTVIGTSILFLG